LIPKKKTQIVEKVLTRKELINLIIKKKLTHKFLSDNQKEFYDTLISNEITICSGPAGTGKSHMSMKTAIELLLDTENKYEKLIIIRPAVEGGESKLGSLPGTYEEKMFPYIFPSIYLLNKIIGKEATEKLKENNIIEILSLSYIRGMNIDNSILIFEEAQNATPMEMKLTLTRIGFNSKFFISGDIEQSDKYKDKEKSGLYDIIHRLQNIENIGIFHFDHRDIVRNPIISKILNKYN
jgi:phosphate starvation-inducible protein PhoH and related proteins